MKSKNLNPVDNYLTGSWEALGNGAPMLVALAQICSHAWTHGDAYSQSSTSLMSHSSSPLDAASNDAADATNQATDANQVADATQVTEPAPATESRELSRQGDPLTRAKAGLSGEALAILFAAGRRGIIEIKAVNTAFDVAARLLAVYVEESDERTIAFRDAHQPEVTVRFLDGFRQLCERGMIIHHIYRDFSLSPAGFEVARSILREQVQSLLDLATEFGLHD